MSLERLFKNLSKAVSTDGIKTKKKTNKLFSTSASNKKYFSGKDAVQWIIANTRITFPNLAKSVLDGFIGCGYIQSKNKSKLFNENEFYFISDEEKIEVEYSYHSYDFAGQEIYYPTHQFFLSPKAIYIVVFDPRKDISETRLEYWLQSINGRAGSESIVYLVATHADDPKFNDKKDVQKTKLYEYLGEVEQKFYVRFPFIRKIVPVSNKTGYEIDNLRKLLVTGAQSLLSNIPPIPVKYRHLENMLLQEKEKRKNLPLLEWSEVTELAKFLDMKQSVLTRAIEFLDHRGIICFFPSLDMDTSNQFITLDPQWLTKCMGNLIGSGLQQSFVRNGLVKRSDLHHIWKHPMFPPFVHPLLLRILESIDVVFLIPNSELILISCLLNENPPDLSEWLIDDEIMEIVRIFHFKYFPSGFFSRIIIRILQLRDPNIISRISYWQTGITIQFRNSASLIVEQFIHKRNLVVRVRGIRNPNLVKFCKDIFYDIVYIVNLFTRYWFNLQTKRYIPCPQCISRLRVTDKEHFTNELLTDDDRIHYFSTAECIAKSTSNFTSLSCNKCKSIHDANIDKDKESSKYLSISDGKLNINLSILAPDLLISEVQTNEISENELDIDKEKPIGFGAFGIVLKANYNEKIVACKTLTDLKSETAFNELLGEVSIMSDLYHPCLVNMIGYCKSPPIIVMEFIPHGNLYDYIKDTSLPISWKFRLNILLNIANALVYLHTMTPPVIHRDLKSPNVLVSFFEKNKKKKYLNNIFFLD